MKTYAEMLLLKALKINNEEGAEVVEWVLWVGGIAVLADIAQNARDDFRGVYFRAECAAGHLTDSIGESLVLVGCSAKQGRARLLGAPHYAH